MTTPIASPRTAARIREEFIDFFRARHAHAVIPSSPVVPHDDPTLLFTNAGMNQFKDVFLGLSEGAGGSRRAVNSQKCIRAGGKHNDLEDVGKDTYHHTFFEMLGNWSFGDYFKEEAITWAWELLTEVWGLDPERLHVTVFEGCADDGTEPDVEAETIWRRFVPAERVSRWGKKDNFWEMGETGPCGPCSEIHYDFTPDRSGARFVNADHPDVIEIWNLVFIQFNRGEDGALKPLPARHVDTGMGFERIVRVLQGKTSNYDTDLWSGLFDAIAKHAGAHPYQGDLTDPVDVAYRVIADHVRCLTVALADGARPGADGRGYVLRRILRRAVRHAHQTLRVEGPLLCDLVPAVVESLGGAFPSLADRPEAVAEVIRDEELSFLRTLDRGLALFEEAAGRSRKGGTTVIAADDAFKLHDTFGFPIDLTRVMAEERGMDVDEAGYEALMEQARAVSRQGGDTERGLSLTTDALAALRSMKVAPTDDAAKFAAGPVTASVRAIWSGRALDEEAPAADATIGIVLDRTNLYAEAGGQVADEGTITAGDARFVVDDVQRFGDYVLHVGRVAAGTLRVGDAVEVVVDEGRRAPVMSNHTATHLLNHALRDVIGADVDQRGSLVAPDRLRFDFTCSHAMDEAQIERTEALVHAAIERDDAVHADLVPLTEAHAINGLRAVFGEKYPDPVRVVSIGAPVADLRADPDRAGWTDRSIELCGGTHVPTTGVIGSFVVVHEQALASGIRRITALTGDEARAAEEAGRALATRLSELNGLDDDALGEQLDEVATEFEHARIGAVRRQRLAPAVEALRDRVKEIRRQARRAAHSGVVDQARAIAEGASGDVIVETVGPADQETLRSALDVVRSKHPAAAAMLLAPSVDETKVVIVAAVPKPFIGQGLKAGDWVREVAKVCGGGGGGRPDMAMAGGKDPARMTEAADVARAFATEAIA